MATLKTAYAGAAAITITLASLAASATLVAGREATAIDNSTNLYADALVGGKITTGTSPVANQIEVWLIGSYDGTTYAGGATGSDANLTPSAKATFRLAQVIPISATSNITYNWGGISVAQAFGGVMPVKWSVFVVQNSTVALNATGGNHEVKYDGITFTIV